jgi:hypothetical protein
MRIRRTRRGQTLSRATVEVTVIDRTKVTDIDRTNRHTGTISEHAADRRKGMISYETTL